MRARKINTNFDTTVPSITDYLGSCWTVNTPETNKWSCEHEECPRVFLIVIDADGQYHVADDGCEDLQATCESLEAACNWAKNKVDTWNKVNACYQSIQARGQALNAALSAEAANRIKTVFKTAQEAVEMPKGFRYTAFRENKSENSVLSTLMYTSAKLGKTQWVMKSALMAEFAGEAVEGSRTGETVTSDSWAFQPNYDPERSDAGREEFMPKSVDKLYNFRPNPDSSTDPDRQAAYWLVGILSDMIDDILTSPPNRVYEYFLADGLLKKKNLAIMDPGGLIRLLNKGIITGPEVLKAKPSMWKKLLEKNYITGEQAYKSQPNQLAWLAIHDYIPVERALKLDPNIEKQLARAGKLDDATPEDVKTDTASLVNYVTDGVLTPQKAWSLNKDVLKPLLEASLITAQDAYRLDPSVLNWMLENHYIGREEATKLKPRIKQEMDRKGVDWESLDASLNVSRKLNADYDYPDEDAEDTFYVAIDDDLIIRVEKQDGRWYESVEWAGEDAREFRTTTYMGYLTHDDIKTWIRRDFPGAYVREMTEDEYYDFLEEQEYDDEDWDDEYFNSSRKLNSSWEDVDEEDWEYVRSKDVMDLDGFNTTYTWFKNADGTRHIFMLTDDEPDPNYADFECETYEEARNWFENYEGFADEDLDSSKKLNAGRGAVGYFECFDDVYKAYYKAIYDEDSETWEFVCLYEDEPTSFSDEVTNSDMDARIPDLKRVSQFLSTYYDEVNNLSKREMRDELRKLGEDDNAVNASRKLNCRGYEDMSSETFRQAVEMLDPDSSAWDDLDELCEAVGYYPDDVGGWDEWFSTLDYDNRCTAWNFVSWVLEDLDSSKKLNCSGDDYFYVSVNMGELILKIRKSAHGEWEEEVIYRDEESAPYYSPSSYMGYLSIQDILSYLKQDFGNDVQIISEEEVDSFMDYDDDWDEDLDSARKKTPSFNEVELIDTIKEVTLNFLANDPMVNFGEDAEAYSAFEFGYPYADEDDYDYYRIEVRAEVGYENLMRLAETLDTVVTRIDPDAYFEPAYPGVLVCVLKI